MKTQTNKRIRLNDKIKGIRIKGTIAPPPHTVKNACYLTDVLSVV